MSLLPPQKTVISRRKKLLFSCLVLVAFFGLLEGILTLAGVGKGAATSDPLLGFSNQHPLFVEDESSPATHLRTADSKLVWFNDQRFSRAKPAGVRRVFCVGGSTTFGRPYSDDTSFCGWLREFLPLADNSTQWEVINAGGVSYASYRVAAVMAELANYEPDLFIVYSGQNEFLERRTYAGLFEQSEWQRNLTAVLAKTRTYSAIKLLIHPDSQNAQSQSAHSQGHQTSSSTITLPAEVDEMLNHTVGPSDYHRDPQWQSDVLKHYRANLQRMTWIAKEAGAGILFVVPASNEKDCSPFKSEFSPTLGDELRAQLEQLIQSAESAQDPETALSQLQAARKIDDGFAGVDFKIGRRLFSKNSFPEAAVFFQAAIDHDVCPLRATTSVQSAVRALALNPDAMIVDFDQLLRQKCQAEYGHSILGSEYFLDHVHPNIETHQQLALWIVKRLQIRGWLGGQGLSPSQIARVDQAVRGRIDTEAHGVALRNLAKVLHWSGKFDEAIPRARDALTRLPDDAESLLVLSDCLRRTNEIDEALSTSERLLEVAPLYERGYLLHGELLFELKQYERAEEILSLAAVMLPADSERQLRAQYLLGLTHLYRNNFHQADELLTRVNRFYPYDLDVMAELAQSKVGVGETLLAIKIYEQIIEQSPTYVEVYQRLGLLLLKEGRFEEARRCFENVIKIDAADSRAKKHLEITEQLLGAARTKSEVSVPTRDSRRGMSAEH